ncbi:MAG TPA: class I SAM-dependent methyltransferase [Gemmatimonadaceae bacterium]
MIEGRASRTAMRVALRRAAHQVFDAPLVLDDPIALRIVGDERAAELRADAQGNERRSFERGMRAFMAVRSRFAEDALAEAVATGTRQYVLLGAGLDTFAYRNPYNDVRVFEVDHPDTQQWKRGRLGEGHVPAPSSLTFAPVNFETQTLADGLANAGFDRSAPAMFAMLGVVPYLTPEALSATWGFVGSGAKGSGIVFDYSIPPSAMSVVQRVVFEVMAARVAAAGEPWKMFFEPAHLANILKEHGFTRLEDLSGAAINARYFADREDKLQVRGVGRLMKAIT